MKLRLVRVASCLALLAPLGLMIALWNSAPPPASRGIVPHVGAKNGTRPQAEAAASTEEAVPSPAQVDEETRQLVANRVAGDRPAEAGAGEVLPDDFLDRVVTGKSFAFALPDGTRADGLVEMSHSDAQGFL